MTPIIAADGALTYAETNLNQNFPEPLNAVTSLFFILLSVYWLVKLKVFSTNYLFLSIASYLLLLGSIGGTAYHAFRQYPIFIMMDWLPILLLCMLGSAYFWSKITHNTLHVIGIIVLFFGVQFFVRKYAEDYHLDWGVNLNYGIMALMVLVPVVIYLVKTRFFSGHHVILSLFFLTLALFFRIADPWQLFPIGTHFLWHIFGALATHSMLMFIYRIHGRRVPVYRLQTLRRSHY